jgi:hypothetical protein
MRHSVTRVHLDDTGQTFEYPSEPTKALPEQMGSGATHPLPFANEGR